MDEKLTRGEQVAWLLQGVIRNWWFLSVILLLTLLCWATGNPTVLTWWNLSASLMAIVIEAVVGRAMFGQTRKDAHVLREILAISQRLETLEQSVLSDLETSDAPPPPPPPLPPAAQ